MPCDASKSSGEQWLSIRKRIDRNCARMDADSKASVLDAMSNRLKLRSTRIRVESFRSRPEIHMERKCSRLGAQSRAYALASPMESRAPALDSKPIREHLLPARFPTERKRSRFDVESIADALESSSSREQLLSHRIPTESMCSRIDVVSSASALSIAAKRPQQQELREGHQRRLKHAREGNPNAALQATR